MVILIIWDVTADNGRGRALVIDRDLFLIIMSKFRFGPIGVKFG